MSSFVAAVTGIVARDGASIIAPLHSSAADTLAIAIDEHTRFVVGSLAKPLTALAVLRLVEEGTLALTDAVQDVLPELRVAGDAGHEIRIDHLLAHSAGLPVEVRAEATFERTWQLHELLSLLAESPLIFTPGERSQYSNVGYSLLGLVIERVSGMAFEAFMAEHVFGPMKMSTASYRVDERTCPGYVRSADGEIVAARRTQPNESPAGGLVLSARDLLQFLTHVLQAQEGSFISPATQRLLLAPSPYRPLPGVRQQGGVPARGFFVERRFGMELAYHSGGKPGYLAYCHVLPDVGAACFTLIAGPLAKASVLWKMHVERVQTLVARGAVQQHGAESEPAFFGYASSPCIDERSYQATAAELAACAGRYGVLGYYDVTFEVRGDTLWTDYGEIAELTPIGRHEFVATRYLPGERVRFVMSADTSRAVGVYVSMTYHQRLDAQGA